jgi:hypothetical protein
LRLGSVSRTPLRIPHVVSGHQPSNSVPRMPQKTGRAINETLKPQGRRNGWPHRAPHRADGRRKEADHCLQKCCSRKTHAGTAGTWPARAAFQQASHIRLKNSWARPGRKAIQNSTIAEDQPANCQRRWIESWNASDVVLAKPGRAPGRGQGAAIDAYRAAGGGHGGTVLGGDFLQWFKRGKAIGL